MPDRQFVFAPFRLDPASQQLWRGAELMPLRPKLFAVLLRLVEQAGRLVTREELRTAAWPTTVVSESVLRGSIRELRDVLEDDATAARFVETVPHRGYRFVAAVTVVQPVHAAVSPAPQTASPADLRPKDLILIGRDVELASLQEWLERALHGSRQVVFVTGEPGIGKTTVVDAFLASTAGRDDVWTARGQCVEQYGSSEPYLPVLEALGQLCRSPHGEQMIALLGRHAPTWLAQMPWLIGEAELEAVLRRVQGATQERMLRELAEALEALTSATPLVLALEDLHWSDFSTLDLISLLAQRRTPARLLLLATYRPADVIVSRHPLKAMKQELRVRQQCEELPLRFLTDVAVGQYLALRFPQQQLPSELAQAIHRTTEGNPLFIVNVVDYWVSQGVLVETAGQWQLTARIEDVAAGVPESLRQMIEKQLSRLTSEECRLIEAASVAGMEFSTAAIAYALEGTGERVEDACEGLARREQFLRARGTETLTNGTVSGRYGFLHALYQQLVYERVAAARRVRLHRRIGEWGEAAYGQRVGDMAAELAVHFERGHDAAGAVRHLSHAGENALRRSAHPEAIKLLTKGVELLNTLPDTPERVRQELVLQATLGATLMVTNGYASPEVERAQTRALELCRQIGEAPQLFPVLAGLWGFRFLRAELHAAGELATQLLRVAQSVTDPALQLWAHTLQGLTLAELGELSPALGHLRDAIALYDPRLHGPDRTRVGAQDPKVTCLSFAAWTLWRLGYPDQARQKVDEAITLAHELGHPFSLAFALDFAGSGVGMLLRDVEAVQTHTAAHMKLCLEQGFPYWLGWGAVRQGWVLTERGQLEAGIAKMRDAMASVQKTGAALSLSYILSLLADAYGRSERYAAGLALVSEALAMVERNDERWFEAELYRLKGVLLLRQPEHRGRAAERSATTRPRKTASAALPARRAASVPDRHAAEAEGCFRTAVEVAQRQQAKSLELRAVVSLSRLWQQQGRRQEAHEMLGEIYAWFTEGFDTADLRDAKALLAELA